jgi:predicted DsbA family dithiol-disulfide isomerase
MTDLHDPQCKGNEMQTSVPVTPQTTLKVWIDFVCPYCLLGEQVIRKAVEGLDNVKIEWMPYELRPYPTPTLRPEDPYLPNAWKDGVYPTAQRLGVEIRLPSVSPQPYTRTAFLGLQYATEHGKADEYADAVLRAFFQQDRDIDKIEVLKDILTEIGIDADGLEAVLSSPEAGAKHDAALRLASEVGIRAVPSVAVGDRLFSGTPSAEALRAEILRQQAQG